jgi:hypothetical protein
VTPIGRNAAPQRGAAADFVQLSEAGVLETPDLQELY